MKKTGKISTFRKFSAVKSLAVILLIICSQFQSIAAHPKVQKASKADTKEFTIIKSGLLPSSTKVEVINQDFPWMVEIHFKILSDEKPRTTDSSIPKTLYTDISKISAPINAP